MWGRAIRVLEGRGWEQTGELAGGRQTSNLQPKQAPI